MSSGEPIRRGGDVARGSGIRRGTLWAALGAGAVLMASAPVFGQFGGLPIDPRGIPAKKSRTSAPAEKTTPDSPLHMRVARQTVPRYWTIGMEARVQELTYRDQGGQYVNEGLKFTQATVVFPAPLTSSSHKLDRVDVKATAKVNGREVEVRPRFQDSLQSGAGLLTIDLGEVTAREVLFNITLPAATSNILFDEAAARTIPWPKGYPPAAQSTFRPMQYVDWVKAEAERPATDKLMAEFIQRTLGDRRPQDMPPLDCAKLLTGAVLETVQMSGAGVVYNPNQTLEGFLLQGAAATLTSRRGNEHDANCVLVGVLRAAGIPSRLVIGLDLTDSKGSLNPALNRGRATLRSWVEFCLVDPDTQREIWVPIDLKGLRKTSSRMQPLERKWKYFGEHEELEYMVPLAFHFHPPASVMAFGSPAMWGWQTTPASQVATQSIRFTANATPQRGSNDPRRAPGGGR